jgi:RNA polymerase sigma factor (TIGR02999 family)
MRHLAGLTPHATLPPIRLLTVHWDMLKDTTRPMADLSMQSRTSADMSRSEQLGVTRLLSAWRSGDAHALERLTPLVYQELRELAHRYMRRERRNHTLQATAVVHEAYVRLVGMDVPWQNRTHFYAVAARLMRRILVDHAKARHREKRGGPVTMVSVDVYQEDTDHMIGSSAGQIDVLEIDEALERLATQDQRLANVVELHYFGGLTYQETAQALEISEATVHRDLRLAKAWILNQIKSVK